MRSRIGAKIALLVAIMTIGVSRQLSDGGDGGGGGGGLVMGMVVVV